MKYFLDQYILPFSILLATIGILLYILSAKPIIYTFDLDGKTSEQNIIVKGLSKKNRLEDNNGKLLEVQDYVMENNEVEIQLTLPDNHKTEGTLVMNIEYINQYHPLIEASIKHQTDSYLSDPIYTWDSIVLENKYLDDYKTYLGGEWSLVTDIESKTVLFQKSKIFDSVQSFLASPPAQKNITQTYINAEGERQKKEKTVSQISTVNTSISKQYIPIPLENIPTNIPYTLRDDAHFWIYFESNDANENISDKKTLDIKFIKQDFNNYDGEDIYELKVLDSNDMLVYSKVIDDDGITHQKNSGEAISHIFNIPDLVSGFYTVIFDSISYGNDTFLKEITLNSPYVGLKKATFIDNSQYYQKHISESKPLHLYIPSGDIEISPLHDDTNIFLNTQEFIISKRTKGTISAQKRLNTLIIPDSDVKIDALHPLYFKEQNIFPNFKISSPYRNGQIDPHIEYVLSSYIPQKKIDINTPRKKTIFFPISSNNIQDNSLFVSLSAPMGRYNKKGLIIKNLSFSYE